MASFVNTKAAIMHISSSLVYLIRTAALGGEFSGGRPFVIFEVRAFGS